MASASELPPPQLKPDVFLSFRGPDTRWGFVSNLYEDLQEQQIQTFKDDRELEIGSAISAELLSAIEESKVAVVVVSPNYASSTWCLEELSKIIECLEAEQITVVPVFYNVDPSHVRYQGESFKKAFIVHEERFGKDAEKVKRWRSALRKLASISGCHSNTYGTERQLIEDIVETVRAKVPLRITFSESDPREKLVGIDSKLEQLDPLLALEADDVRFIGIWGMGGIGKTTLAKLFIERISCHFDVFISLDTNVDSSVPLPNKILSQISKKQNTGVLWNVSNNIKKNLCKKKVLVFVDDGDRLKQLDILVRNKDWFGMGSRIIITTRDQRLLVQHGIENPYQVEKLKYGDAIQLFSKEAFGKDQPEEEFLELSQSFVDYAAGHPLALKLLGSSLYKRELDYWKCAFRRLKSLDSSIFNCLKFSYDGLRKDDQSIFLDIAFCHKGKDKDQVIEELDNCGFYGRSGIDVLVEKSLLTVEKSDFHFTVEMHDLIQEMAWEIVRQKSPEEPGERTRLCHRDDIFHVFKNNTGTRAVQVIVLILAKLEEADWNRKAFSKMTKLRILQIHNLILLAGPKSLPNSLRILKWSWYPSKFLPPSFQPYFLAELSLTDSKLVQLWENARVVNLPNLKTMNLSYSENLTCTPDFRGIQNLEKLIVVNCKNLVKVHPSIADLKKLKICDFRDCKSIEILPREVQMESLEFFSLYGCSKVKKIPEFSGQMKNVSMLSISGTAIEEIPSSIEQLIGLDSLSLSDCKSLSSLPSAVCNLKSLKWLYLSGCAKLDKLPENLGEMESLETLELEGTNIRVAPASLVRLKNLKVLSFRGPNPGLVLTSLHGLCSLSRLDLSDCNLSVVPDTIGCLCSLQELDLSKNHFVSLPASISRLSKLGNLTLKGCTMLQQFPDLPSNKILNVHAEDCTSLKMLADPPILGRGVEMWEFTLDSGNCFGLVDDEGYNTIVLPMLRRFLQGIPRFVYQFQSTTPGRKIPNLCPSLLFATVVPMVQGIARFVYQFQITTPGREIPNWFIPSELKEDSFIVELPPPSCCREWMGIAFCLLFEVPAGLLEFDFFQIGCSSVVFGLPNYYTHGIDHLRSDHLWVSYVSRTGWSNPQCSEIKVLIETFYDCNGVGPRQKCSIVKSCGYRLVFEKDVEDLNLMMEKSTSTTSPYCEPYCEQCDKATSFKRTRDEIEDSDESSCDEIEESLCKRLKAD